MGYSVSYEWAMDMVFPELDLGQTMVDGGIASIRQEILAHSLKQARPQQ